MVLYVCLQKKSSHFVYILKFLLHFDEIFQKKKKIRYTLIALKNFEFPFVSTRFLKLKSSFKKRTSFGIHDLCCDFLHAVVGFWPQLVSYHR